MITVSFQNVRHYWSNREKLVQYWREINPDIILLNSTSILPDKPNISLPGYHSISSPKGIANGSAILIRNTIRYKVVTGFRDPFFLALKTFTEEGEVIFATHYCPFSPNVPNSKIPSQDIRKLLDLNVPMYLLADLNAQHPQLGHKRSDQRGRGKVLADLIQKSTLQYLGPAFPTFRTLANIIPRLGSSNYHILQGM